VTIKSTIVASFFSASLVAAFFVANENSLMRTGLHITSRPLAQYEPPMTPKRDVQMSEHVKSGEVEDEVPKKGGIAGSVAYKSPSTTPVQSESETAALQDDVGFSDVPEAQPVALQLPEGIPAMLHKGLKGIEIGHFRAATIAGDTEDCLSTAYSMLASAQIPDTALNILVATKPITIAKLCANNGVVLFTCRNNSITVSPRRLRPDNSCPSNT
jgi:hypothetical protein